MATVRKKTPATPKVKTPVARRRRRVTRTVQLNPDLSNVRLVVTAVENVIDSLGFWHKRLKAIRCPQCNVAGSLRVDSDMSYGIAIYCHRECDYDVEVIYEK